MTSEERISRAVLELRLYHSSSPSARCPEDVIAQVIREAVAEEREAAARLLDEQARIHDVAAAMHTKVLNSPGDASDQAAFASVLRSAAASIRARVLR